MDDVLWLRHFQEKQGMEGNAVDGTHPCASKTPAGASGSCIVGDVFFGWDIKTTNPQALVIQEPVVLSTRAGVFNPPSWREASGNSSMKRRLSLRHHISASCHKLPHRTAGESWVLSQNWAKQSLYIVYLVII